MGDFFDFADAVWWRGSAFVISPVSVGVCNSSDVPRGRIVIYVRGVLLKVSVVREHSSGRFGAVAFGWLSISEGPLRLLSVRAIAACLSKCLPVVCAVCTNCRNRASTRVSLTPNEAMRRMGLIHVYNTAHGTVVPYVIAAPQQRVAF